MDPRLSELPSPDPISFSLSTLLPPAAPSSQGKGKKSEVIIAPLRRNREKGNILSVYVHTGPKQKLRVLAKIPPIQVRIHWDLLRNLSYPSGPARPGFQSFIN